MKREMQVSMLVLLAILVGGTVLAEGEPERYVNAEAAFSVAYPTTYKPADPQRREVFRAEPEGRYPSFRVWFMPNLRAPVANLSRLWSSSIKPFAEKANLLYDNAVKTTSGVGAQEIELEWVTNDKTPVPGTNVHTYCFAVQAEKGWVVVGIYDTAGKIGDDLKRFAYSVSLDSVPKG